MWLKRCLVPFEPRDFEDSLFCYTIGQRAIFKLTCHHGLSNPWEIKGVLPTFYWRAEGKPRVEIPYAYLMASFAAHCKGFMFRGVDADKEGLPTLSNRRKTVEASIFSGGEEWRRGNLLIVTIPIDSLGSSLILMLLSLWVTFMLWAHCL